MDYSRLNWTIYFKPKHMSFFQKNRTHIQEFMKDAADEAIKEEEMKKQGYVKKFVKEN